MKKIYLFLVGIVAIFTGITTVEAASANVSVSSSVSKIVVGKTFKITVKVSSSTVLGAWEYTLGYDSSKVSLTSSEVPLRYVGYGNGSIRSKSYTYTFKALKSGSAQFNISKTAIVDWNENILSVDDGSRSTTVSIITQADLEASYSKNNNLSNLSISGYELSPKFNKNTTNYEITVPSTVTKITINATREDSKSSLLGTGEFAVSEGLNTFLVKVTAQNGDLKTYTLNVNVEDLNPITVKILNKEYTVVKRSDLLECPSAYQATTVTINDIEIPACSNEASKYNLVALKDQEGNIGLFIYDKNIYIKYQEFIFANLIFSPILYSETIKNYEQTKVKINNEEVAGYVFNSGSDFFLLYGKNIETGKNGFYVYDQKEKTLQRYNDEQILALENDLKDYMIITIIFGSGLFVTIIASLVIISNKKKKAKKVKEKAPKEEKKIEKKQ